MINISGVYLMINLTDKQVKEILKLTNVRTWKAHLETIGLDPKIKILEWEHIRALYTLQLYLNVGQGVNSKASFETHYKGGTLWKIQDEIRKAGVDYSVVINQLYESIENYLSTQITEGIEFSREEQ